MSVGRYLRASLPFVMATSLVFFTTSIYAASVDGNSLSAKQMSKLFEADKIYAVVNGQNVTNDDIMLAMQFIPQTRGASFDSLTPEVQKQIIEQAIDNKLIAQDALKSDVVGSPEYKKNIELAKNSIVVNLWLQRKFNDMNVTQKDIKNFYDKNKDDFELPERVKAKNILVKDEKTASEIISDLKGLKGEALAKKYDELAKKYSEAESEVDIGWFTRDQMVKPFSDVAFALEEGTINSKPVKTDFGYHVILVEGKESKSFVSLKDASSDISNYLKAQEFKTYLTNLKKSLRSTAKIEIK